MTAQQIVDRIQQQIGSSWKSSPADVFHAGHPDSAVTGIVTTFAPSLDMLRRAVASKKNMIISREAPFWAGGRGERSPAQEALNKDPTYRFKRDFIQSNNLIVWRFFDNWNARKPDGQLVGLARALGWTGGNGYFPLPSATLKETAARRPVKA